MENAAFTWYFSQALSTEEIAVWCKIRWHGATNQMRTEMEDSNGKRFLGKPALLARAPHPMGRPLVRLEQ